MTRERALVDSLKADAVSATGLTDFGRDEWEDGLHRFVTEFVDTPGLDAATIDGIARVIIGPLLCDRLRLEAATRVHANALANPIVSPVVITGIPRSGTTALHQLLAVDPQFQVVEKWLINDPRPRPPREQWHELPSYRDAVAAVELVPESLRRSHFVHPDDPDECLVPLSQSFVSNFLSSLAPVPKYEQWCLANDSVEPFRRYADFLRVLGSSSPEKTWLLKNPTTVFYLDALLTVFPDARVIQTHRHPLSSIASLASTIAGGGEMFGYHRPLSDIAAREINWWATGLTRAMEFRRQSSAMFHDVDFREFNEDPLRVVQGIYSDLSLDLTAETRHAMEGWVSANPKGRHGDHSYDGEAMGVSPEAIDASFEAYIKEYSLQ